MKWLRKILFPFSGLYYLITLTRNWAYDRGLLSSTAYDFPVICIGNLNTGGTGKSPMTEYLTRLLLDQKKPVILSRGYGRKTRGFLKVDGHNTPRQVGDEPLQFAKKFPQAAVFVCEDRREGILQINELLGRPDVLLLDDAYQHRGVTAGLNVLLTSYDDLYTDDYLLPAGNLREPRTGANRADLIVVTKCPLDLSQGAQQKIVQQLAPQKNQRVFFAGITYDQQTKGDLEIDVNELQSQPFRVVTGIANPKPFINELRSKDLRFEHLAFGDHHSFTEKEIATLDRSGLLLTTEKDYMRLEGKLQQATLCYLPISISILRDADVFEKRIASFVNKRD